jgi:hypothetical protein
VWGINVRPAATNWTAVGSLSTFGAAAVALVAVLVTLWVYSRQNRLARVAVIRSLMAVVLRSSGQIYSLTLESAIVMAESEVRAFRDKLGSSADADTFRKYFFQQDYYFVVWSSVIAGYVTSPAYSRLSDLWDEIDKASAELRGTLKIFKYSAKLITDTSRFACYPQLSLSLVEKMRHDPKLAASYDNISNLDELTLAVATKLGRKLYKELTPYVPDRLYYVASFVEDLYAAIGSMKDRYVLRLTWDRRFDWHRLSMVPATSAAAAPSGPAVGSPSASASTTAPVPLRETIAEGLDNAAPRDLPGPAPISRAGRKASSREMKIISS